MEISEEIIGDVTLVTVGATRIDAAYSFDFRDQIIAAVDRAKRKVVLDLGNVAMMDSSGLGAVIAALKRHGSSETFVVAGLQDSVERLFLLTRMDRVFKIVDTPSDGLTFLANDFSSRFRA